MYGHTFFCHNTAIFLANWAEINHGESGDYYFLIGQEKYKLSLSSDFNFLAGFGEKMGVVATQAPKGMEPKNPTEKLAHWVDLLSQLLSRKHIFRPQNIFLTTTIQYSISSQMVLPLYQLIYVVSEGAG